MKGARTCRKGYRPYPTLVFRVEWVEGDYRWLSLSVRIRYWVVLALQKLDCRFNSYRVRSYPQLTWWLPTCMLYWLSKGRNN